MAGTAIKDLYRQAGFRDTMRLERWEAGTDRGRVAYPEGAELLVLDGEFSDEAGSYPCGCWIRQPSGSTHHPRTANGCELYIKTGGFAYLQSGD